MTGYSTQRFGDWTVTVSSDIAGCLPDRQWQALCEDLCAGRIGCTVKQGAHKTLVTCTLGETACLMKVYRPAGAWKLLRSLFSESRAGREFRSACFVRDNRIAAPRALLLAERRRLGCITCSIVGIEYLSGVCELRELLFQKKALPAPVRAELARDFGRLTARIFASDVFQYDYSLNNFLVRRDAHGCELYLIDYERVEAGRALTEKDRLRLLAKLNRVGCEVRLSDRLRFLQGYCDGEAHPAQARRLLAREVQRQTVRHLQQDLQRGRLTSLYTHGECDRIRHPGVSGLVRKGCSVPDVLGQFAACSGGVQQHRAMITVRCDQQERRLHRLCFPKKGASRIWAVCSAFRIAGLPLEQPHALLEDARTGMLLVPADWIERLAHLLAQPSRINAFLQEQFPDARAVLMGLLDA
jgi:tRNA A-37 threonylcarbamoyl transferase component Bud32